MTTPDAQVSIEIAAPADAVWSLVADLPKMGAYSPENDGATWLGSARSATVGARFKGSNRNEKSRWSTTGTITEAEPGRALAFRVTVGPFKVADWRYELAPTDGGCQVTESFVDLRGGFVRSVGKRTTGVADRAAHNTETMRETLAKLKVAAEATPTA